MWLLRPLLFRWVWRRLTGRGNQRSRGSGGSGGRTMRGYGAPRGYGRQSAGRGGFLGPLPYYSRRTRGGSRVTVSGCCLPLTLGMLGAPALVLRAALRR